MVTARRGNPQRVTAATGVHGLQMVSLIKLFDAYSDQVILVAGALTTVLLALAIAYAAHRLWFAIRLEAIEEHNKLADVVHGSLLAFTVFVLALVLADVRANLGRADDMVSREGSYISRLSRDLGSIGSEAALKARGHLKSYVQIVASEEWRTLSRKDATLAPGADRAMAELVAEVRALAAAHTDVAGSLRAMMDKIEEHRQIRQEIATKTVPNVFWWIITMFLFGAMIMNGRHKLNLTTLSLISMHMAAIGLVLALIVIMDEPFRGETSISPASLLKAVMATSATGGGA
jgi:hypothetical protein